MASSASSLSPTVIEPALAVRLLLGVARLGEADLAGWWSSQGMNPAVRFSLAGFRWTSTVVGAELAVLSATRRHRQILPRDTAVHLFSPYLPFAGWTRAYLAEAKTTGESEIVDELLGWTTGETGRSQLRSWLEPVEVLAREGTSVRTGELEDPTVTTGLLVRFAEAYIALHGELTVPYVDLAP